MTQTLVYYSLESVARTWIRTTSLLERTNRQLRRKFRQAVTFGSRKGAEVAIYLQLQRLHASWTDEPRWETSHALYFDLWNLNHSGRLPARYRSPGPFPALPRRTCNASLH